MGAAGSRKYEPAELEEVIRRVGEGRHEAKAWLYDRFAPNLVRRIRSSYGNDPRLDAEELLHDLFVWCFDQQGAVLTAFLDRNAAELRTEYRLQGYLWGLVRGLASNRRRSAHRAPEIRSIDELPSMGSGDSEQVQLQRDAARRLIDCIHTHGSRVALYLALRFVEGLTPDEITRVTGWERGETYKMRGALKSAVRGCVEKLGL